jgi:hypothetical protein
MTKEYKYIVSLSGGKYLVYYNEIDANGVITQVVRDIDIAEGQTNEDVRQEDSKLFYEALDKTDPIDNHKQTIEYVKTKHIDKLNKLYFSFFQNHVKYIDDIPFYINSQYLHYYNEFVQCIERQSTTIPFYFDFENKEIHWNTHIIQFDKFLEYTNIIKIYIATLNKNFQQDKEWIQNLDAMVDFSNMINIENEKKLMDDIIARKNEDKIQLVQELKKIIIDFDETTDDAWGTIVNCNNPMNQEFLTDLTKEQKNILQQYVDKHNQYNVEFVEVQQMINSNKPNYLQTEERLNNIITKWSI